MATHVNESAVLKSSIEKVWAAIRSMEFVWNPKVMSVRQTDGKQPAGALAVGEERVIVYRDDTKQRVRLLTLSDAQHTLSWEVVESTPAVTYSGAVHTISLRRVTFNVHSHGHAHTHAETYAEWNVDFARDASAEVLADAKFKIGDAFKAIGAESAKELNFYTTASEAATFCLKEAKLKDLSGRTFLITGANTGLGLETARALMAHNARVVATVRDEKKARATEEALNKLVPHAQHKAQAMVCALDSFTSIRAFAAAWYATGHPLHCLILNAGVMALPEIAYTEEKFELQIGVNHFGHFLLTQLLTPALRKAAPARVVVLSSAGHHIGDVNWDDINWQKAGAYEGWKAYGASKSANIHFANALHALFAKEKAAVSATALHPGVILETDLGRHLKPGGAIPPYRFKSVAQGAATTIVAALHPKYATEGGYLADCNPCPVAAHISAAGAADRLWALTEKLIAERTPKK